MYLLTGCCRCKAAGAKAYYLYFESLTTQQMWYPASRYVGSGEKTVNQLKRPSCR